MLANAGRVHRQRRPRSTAVAALGRCTVLRPTKFAATGLESAAGRKTASDTPEIHPAHRALPAASLTRETSHAQPNGFRTKSAPTLRTQPVRQAAAGRAVPSLRVIVTSFDVPRIL